MTAQEQVQHLRAVGDGLSIGTVISTLVGWLPAFAALASIIWTAIRIYETKTVQDWLARRRANV